MYVYIVLQILVLSLRHFRFLLATCQVGNALRSLFAIFPNIFFLEVL